MPTPRYRAVNAGSHVDETLFGEPLAKTFRNSRRIVTGPVAAGDVVVGENELFRIKNAAITRSEAQQQAEKDRIAAIRAEKQKVSNERKTRMKELEIRSEKAKKKSDIEVDREARADALRKMAAEKLVENGDVVKQMKSMAARAQAFSIRDRQLLEKKEREEIEAEIDRRQDIMMEIDRVKDIKRREEIEVEKARKRREDGKVITEQIEVRRRHRLLEAEQREQEAQQMVQRMKKLEEQDAIVAAKKAVEVEKSRKEVIKANEAFIAAKEAAKQAAVKEMEDLILYQAQKDKELADREAELAAAEAAKKARQAQLLEQQERAQDNAGKMDELRARRAAEEYERRMRREEKEKAAKKRAETEDLLRSRAKQQADKQRIAEEDKITAQEEVRQGLMYIKKMDEREAADQAHKKRMADKHREVLHEQIEVRAKIKRDGRGNTFAEGDKARLERIKEVAKLDVIRDNMVKRLEAEGVNPAYLSEMKKMDINAKMNQDDL
jgi:hypothetical protein